MLVKLRVCLCLCILSVIFWKVSETLDSGDDGVCVVKISTKKSRIKLVPTKKMCGRQKCTVKKVEYYSAPEERIVCCNGWEYEVSSDSCKPVCIMGCLGGRCVSPDVCQCDPPANLDPTHKNTCIQPKCDPPCVNAQCWTNNTCSCLTNYSRFNDTHCLKCDPGYTINGGFFCDPICDEKCINGKCTEPNKCSCLEGYKSVDKNVCEPQCESCVNATCVAPNTCSCLEGYTKVNETTCEPSCEHCDGDCVAPNVCVCRDGFINIDGVCKPVCESCDNGVCVAPGNCICNEGYVKSGGNSSKCVKSCEQPIEVEKR